MILTRTSEVSSAASILLAEQKDKDAKKSFINYQPTISYTKKHMSKKGTLIQDIGEFGLIDRLTKGLTLQSARTLRGVGDDAAVIRVKDNTCMLVTTDMLLEGVHFDLMYAPLKHLGYKSVVASLSDVCAMNALPEHITASIAISSKFYAEAIDELYDGIKQACSYYHVDLVGGDTTSSTKGLVISISAMGVEQKNHIVYRNSAKPGDLICVTGDLGAAYLGLLLLEREKAIFLENPAIQPDLKSHQYLVQRRLKPEARTDMIKLWRQEGFKPTSMIDVSDGLASDLLHICTQSQVGAVIEEDLVPIKEETKLLALDFKIAPITCALSGGEDYELLFTADPKDLEKIKYLPDISIIGEVLPEEKGVHLQTSGKKQVPIIAQGWNHFNRDKTKE